MSNNDVIITLKNVNKTFYVHDNGATFLKKIKSYLFGTGQKIHALSNINFEVKQGEFIGIIGRNGSGKSTLLRIIMAAIKADKGSIVQSKGRMIRLALGMGFDANLTARDNIFLNGSILGLPFKTIKERFDDIIGFSELEDFVDTPIRFYSSGMKSRLSFAIAIHADADIYLIDEFFGSVGDSIFQEKSQRAFEENILKGKTIIHVSHAMGNIKKHCDRVMLLEKGNMMIYEDPMEAVKVYKEMRGQKKRPVIRLPQKSNS